MRKRKSQRSGYVLVMTLLLVGLCGAILARIAQQGLQQALAASRQTAELQQRWARQSCRLQLLQRASWVLESAAADTEQDELGWPFPAAVQARFRLGQIECEVVLADEEAKPSVNLIHAERPELLSMALGTPVRGATERSFPVKLSPVPETPGRAGGQAFQSWGQVYDLAAHGYDIRALRSASSQLTCWGQRRLNLARASDESLEFVASLALNGPEVQSLLEVRGGYSGDLNEMLKLVDVPGRKKASLRRLVSDRSSCYSMWLTMTSGSQTAALLAIGEAGRADGPPTISFYWP